MAGLRLARRLVLVTIALLPARLHAGDSPSAAQLMDDLMWTRGPIGGPFALVDHTGRRRTDADFRGKLLVIYFGYVSCPDTCPADLMSIALALGQLEARLGATADAVQPIFITLDPERDSVERLAEYVAAFHPRLIGLTGTPDEIRAVATAYKTWYAKKTFVNPSAGHPSATAGNAGAADYAVDHTAFIYLAGKDGRYLGFLPPSTTPERLSDVIGQMLSREQLFR
jgi:cytochrome oxidase Cu insertion factor (SCO1/SenC/PrrC family)